MFVTNDRCGSMRITWYRMVPIRLAYGTISLFFSAGVSPFNRVAAIFSPVWQCLGLISTLATVGSASNLPTTLEGLWPAIYCAGK